MIDAAAEALARRILVVFPASTSRTRADVKRIQVPVGRLLGAMLDRQADRLAALPETEWLDRRHRDLPAAAGAWRDAVRLAAQFPAEAWEEAVAQASRLALSHLVRPAETAAADAFADGAERLPVPAALARVRVFGAYGYLPEIAARYAERKGIADLDRPGLERLLRRIDRRMVEDFGPDEWVALTGPLYDLLGPISQATGTVGTGLLRALFEAKGRHEVARTLISDTYTREALHAHLSDVIVQEPSAPAAMLPALTPSAAEPSRPPEPVAPEPVAPEPVAPDPIAPEPVVTERAVPEPSAEDERGVTGVAPTPIDAVEPVADGDAETSSPAEAPTAEAFEPERPPAPDLAELPATPPEHDPAPGDAAPEELATSESEPPIPDLRAAPPAGLRPLLDLPTADPAANPAADPAAADPAAEAPPLAPPVPESVSPRPDTPAPAEPTAPSPAEEPEPLWKRMLRPTPAAPLATEPGYADAPPSVAPLAPPADDEPLWRRFAAPDDAPTLDDEGGWDVEPTLAAAPDVPASPPAPPRTLADTFALPATGMTAGAPDLTPPVTDPAPPEPAEPVPSSPAAVQEDPPSAPDAAAHAAAPLDALELTVLGSGAMERREWFVNDLFDGSRDDYRDTLRQLADAQNWTASTEIIAREVFRKHRVNIYSEASLAFTDAVEARMDGRAT